MSLPQLPLSPGATVSTTMEASNVEQCKMHPALVEASACQQLNLTTVASPDGTWRQTLPATAASKVSFRFQFSSSSTAKESATMEDVLFGDVYICGGQSNMVPSTACFDIFPSTDSINPLCCRSMRCLQSPTPQQRSRSQTNFQLSDSSPWVTVLRALRRCEICRRYGSLGKSPAIQPSTRISADIHTFSRLSQQCAGSSAGNYRRSCRLLVKFRSD